MQLPNSIHLNPKNMHDIHPKKLPVGLSQFFHLLFLTNSIISQYRINQITNKNDNKNNINFLKQNRDLTNLRTHEIIYSTPQISFDGKEALKQNLKIMYM